MQCKEKLQTSWKFRENNQHSPTLPSKLQVKLPARCSSNLMDYDVIFGWWAVSNHLARSKNMSKKCTMDGAKKQPQIRNNLSCTKCTQQYSKTPTLVEWANFSALHTVNGHKCRHHPPNLWSATLNTCANLCATCTPEEKTASIPNV